MTRRVPTTAPLLRLALSTEAAPALVLALVVALAAGVAAPGALAAQAVEGRVLDPGDEVPLPGVHLSLLDDDDRSAATALSDETGLFHLAAPRAGRWRLAAELLGYGSALSNTLDLAEGDTVRVEVRMGVDPIRIEDPVVVIAEPRVSPDIADFHRRRDWGERTGLGHFIYGEALERGAAGRPTDLLRMVPGVSLARGAPGRGAVVQMRGRCIPAIFIDGSQINQVMRGESLDTYVSVQGIEGIEVYRGAQQPGGRFIDRSGCGVILVWTQRGEYDSVDGSFNWSKLLIGLGLIAGLVIIF